MAANLTPVRAAQVHRLRQQQANIDRMISSIVGKEAAASILDPLAPTVKILGFQDFTKPKGKKWNLQSLVGLSDNNWGIYKADLWAIAMRQGVDQRYSIKNQPIQLHVTNTVNEMINFRPEIGEKVSDPDWLIKQTLKAMLKSSRETHNNRVTGKPPRKQKPKKKSEADEDEAEGEDANEGKGKGKDKGKDEDEDEDEDEDKSNDKRNTEERKGKERDEPEQGQEQEQEQEDTEMTDAGVIPNRSVPEASTGDNSDMDTDNTQAGGEPSPFNNKVIDVDSTPVPVPRARARPKMKESVAERLHTARFWSSPVNTPFTSGGHDPSNDVSNGEPTPIPTKTRQIFNTQPPIQNGPASFNGSDSDEAEDYGCTPKPPSFTVKTNNAKGTNQVSGNRDQASEREVPGANARINQLPHAAPTQSTTEPNSPLETGSHDRHENAAAVTTAPTVDTNLAGSKKRKASDDDATPEAPAPKKGKATATPARAYLSKNFETPLPASPSAKASRLTRSKVPQPPAAGSSSSSSSSAPPPPPPPAVPKPKLDRTAIALKAAATRRANKLMREAAAQAKAENKSNERTTRKK